MKRVLLLLLCACLLLGGCAKNNQTVWRVSTLGSGEEINLPVAKNVGFCALPEKKIDENAPAQRTITVDGKTYTCPYTETEYVPGLKGPALLKERRVMDCYENKDIDFAFFSGTNTVADFYRSADIIAKDGDCTEENAEERARYYLKLFYNDADQYTAVRITKEKMSTQYYKIVFIKKVQEISSTDCITIWLDLAGELFSLTANDYQIYDGVEISTEQVNEAKTRLDTAIAENGLVSEGGLRVVMGDDGELYLSVQASYYEAHNAEVGVTILEELFTRL
ncbi:MAG: hypothetical protein DBX52_02745 [Clostridiales bacterium]|nr:MAG: hypothetical protein DBX52_02745 [Clostridiales bacterium]